MKTELPVRKRNRMEDFDYSTEGAYFITICTEKRAKTLSHIEMSASCMPHDTNTVLLTKNGVTVKHWIEQIAIAYPSVVVDCFVIMPNHIHLILLLHEDKSNQTMPSIGSVIAWLKYHVTKEINQSQKTLGNRFFQRSFHDHIIRNKNDYSEIKKYIQENPRNWVNDSLFVADSTY